MDIIIVGLGGFVGSCLRFLLTRACRDVVTFPLGTLLSNVLAGLCIGVIAGLDQTYLPLPPRTRQFITMGILGGLSTFSTFSMESFILFQQGKWLLAGGNVLLNLGLSVLFIFIGITMVRVITASA